MKTTYYGDTDPTKVYFFNKGRGLEEKVVNIIKDNRDVRFYIELYAKQYLELNASRILDSYIDAYLRNQQHFNSKSYYIDKQKITDSIIDEVMKAIPKKINLLIK